MPEILGDFILNFPFTKFFIIFIIFLFYFRYVKKKREIKQLKTLILLVPVLAIRDFLFTIYMYIRKNSAPTLPEGGFIILISDILIAIIFLIWLRLYTGKRKTDTIFCTLNIAACVFIVFNAFLQISDLLPYFFHFWIIANYIFLSLFLRSITEYNTGNAQIILETKQSIVRVPILVNSLYVLIFLLLGVDYEIFFIQNIMIPLSYFLFLFIIHRYNQIADNEISQQFEFIQNDIESLFDFMRNLGSAIAEKLDLEHTLDFIISSAVKSADADGGAILIIDEQDSLLKVQSVTGTFPTPYAVPDRVKLKLSTIESYFKSTPIKMGETVLGEAAESGQPIFIRNTATDERMKHNTQNDTLFVSSIIVIPLIIQKRVLGVLSVLIRQQNKFFTENDFLHIRSFADFASLAFDFIMTYFELIEKKEMERELGIAAEIQQKLLPAKLPKIKSATLAAFSVPAKGVSGDYFDVLPLKKNKVALVMCDVAGKGVPAALVMVMIRSILHLITSAEKDAATIVTWINRGISGRIDIDHFATLSFLTFDQESGEVLYSNAAHHPLMLWRANTKKIETIDTEGLPLGIERNMKYAQKRFVLQKGDVILLYTDGIIEAMDSNGQQYSYDALKKIVTQNAIKTPSELITSIKADIKKFVGNARQHDDQTLLLMKKN